MYLVVDDHPTNRDFLVTLLGYWGHRLLEAADGAEALAVARAERPDLIISDILMPTMDGYEFVRQLRADPDLAHTPVIFSTAHYLDHEASALAQQCGVPFILPKPCEPEAVLTTVDAALGIASLSPDPATSHDDAFDREHLRLLTNQLAEKAEALQAMNEKMAALQVLGQRLVSEHDSAHILEDYARGAREIVGAQWAAVGILNEDELTLQHIFVSGLRAEIVKSIDALPSYQGVLGNLLRDRRPYRLQNIIGEPQVLGLPAQFPPVYSFLGMPIAFQGQAHGWLCLANKLGSNEFNEVDERLAVMLAAQMAVAHENAHLFSSVQRQAAVLRREVAERQRAEAAVRELNAALEQRVRERTAELEVANEELEEFSSSVAHDLKAPLRSIDGFSELFLEEYGDGLHGQGKDYLRRVREAAQRTAQLIDDLLSLSRVTRSDMEREIVDLSALARNIAAELRRTQPTRQMTFCIAAGLALQGDGRLLRVVLENLLGNAWKFTSKQPRARIEFGVADCHGRPMYFVRDNGAGFNMAYADKLFRPFQRLHSTADFAGTGIGLATVQRIIHRHGGRIWAEGAVGQGATFYFTLPGTESSSP